MFSSPFLSALTRLLVILMQLLPKINSFVSQTENLGNAHSEETGFVQLFSCNVGLQLHETSALIPDKKNTTLHFHLHQYP
jgi:hypothetical protein